MRGRAGAATKCRHDQIRTVMIEVTRHGDLALRVYCGDIHTEAGCGTVVRDEFIGNADVGQLHEVRVGERKFFVKIGEVRK